MFGLFRNAHWVQNRVEELAYGFAAETRLEMVKQVIQFAENQTLETRFLVGASLEHAVSSNDYTVPRRLLEMIEGQRRLQQAMLQDCVLSAGERRTSSRISAPDSPYRRYP